MYHLRRERMNIQRNQTSSTKKFARITNFKQRTQLGKWDKARVTDYRIEDHTQLVI